MTLVSIAQTAPEEQSSVSQSIDSPDTAAKKRVKFKSPPVILKKNQNILRL